MSHLILLAVPLFVFLGLLIEMTGMARAMVDFLASLLGHVRGGLSYVLLGAMYLVSGISGSKAADMAAVAPALFPEMKQRGAKPGELVALLVGHRRADRDDSAEPRADHDRLGRPACRSPRCSPAACCRRWCSALALCAVVWLALPRRGPVAACARATRRADRQAAADRAAGARAAVRDPRRGGRGRRDRDRGLDHRHRLHGASPAC